MKRELYERFGDVLDVLIHHLREGRERDAAAVIDALPDDQVRNFAFFLAMHVERDLDVLRREVRDHWIELDNVTRPSTN